MPNRGFNCSSYRLHVYGTLCGKTIDKKYCSLNEFIREYEGDKTPMNLNKFKVIRLKKRWNPHQKKEGFGKDATDDFIKKNWGLVFDKINVKRQHKRKVSTVYFD